MENSEEPRERRKELTKVVRRAWAILRRAEAEGFGHLVRPSIPILFFGDSERYLASSLKVITVGLNPSRAEFPDGDRFARFPAARDLYPGFLGADGYSAYMTALNDYFRVEPYSEWFNPAFESLLGGLGASYYGGEENTALHTDLCSPLATNPTWSRLPSLEPEGVALWHELAQALTPDVVLISVARAYIKKIRFRPMDVWHEIYRLERPIPFFVEAAHLEVKPGKTATFIFGRAAQLPFGTLSSVEKGRIGTAIRGLRGGG